uniref:Avidin n=1 Tax=Pelusios castaneus TaxID=367368 RepID=A0A8C8SCK6_9SAUR
MTRREGECGVDPAPRRCLVPCYGDTWGEPGTSQSGDSVSLEAKPLAALVTEGSLAVSPLQCTLTGTWSNELGSNMTISAVNAAGEFSGSYHTAVTATRKSILASPLKGSQQRANQRKQPTFGFSVQWQFSDTTTVFVGQCFVDKRGKEKLETMWLLRDAVGSRKDSWKATRVGSNTFTRIAEENVGEPLKNIL